jgi:hypothetical protein
MTAEGSKLRLALIAILAITLLMTSLQAKLGLYYPEHSQAQLVSKAFKLSECRLARAVPEPPAVTVQMVALATEVLDPWHPEPDFLEYTPTQLSPLLSRSHWFRPPPRS